MLLANVHELTHINGDDFYSELQAGSIERITHDAEHDADLLGVNFYCHVLWGKLYEKGICIVIGYGLLFIHTCIGYRFRKSVK